jgi:hypothetical protein
MSGKTILSKERRPTVGKVLLVTAIIGIGALTVCNHFQIIRLRKDFEKPPIVTTIKEAPSSMPFKGDKKKAPKADISTIFNKLLTQNWLLLEDTAIKLRMTKDELIAKVEVIHDYPGEVTPEIGSSEDTIFRLALYLRTCEMVEKHNKERIVDPIIPPLSFDVFNRILDLSGYIDTTIVPIFESGGQIKKIHYASTPQEIMDKIFEEWKDAKR